MKFWQSCVISFSMYSKIPMPRVDWTPEGMKYAICFFPLVGAACGGALWMWSLLSGWLGVAPSGILWAAVCALLPLLVTGGIHLDGFCDTVDALSSHREAARRLEILKDPHIGAFGVMGCVAYLLLSFALWTQPAASEHLLTVGIGYLLSRSLSGLSVVSFRGAKKEGTLAAFSSGAQKNVARGVLGASAVFCAAAMVWTSPVAGTASVAAALLAFAVYRVVSYKQFGGITGDLAGWFLCLCELAILAAVVLASPLYH